MNRPVRRRRLRKLLRAALPRVGESVRPPSGGFAEHPAVNVVYRKHRDAPLTPRSRFKWGIAYVVIGAILMVFLITSLRS